MSSMTSNMSDNKMKLNSLNSPISHAMRPYNTNTFSDIDTKSVGSKSTTSRTSKLTYSEYPQVRPTNPLYSSTFSIRSHSSAISNLSKTSTVVERRKKFDPHAPRHPDDWRWFAILCTVICPCLGPVALGLAFKAQNKFRDGFIDEARKINKRALILCIISTIISVSFMLTFLFVYDAWPRSNG